MNNVSFYDNLMKGFGRPLFSEVIIVIFDFIIFVRPPYRILTLLL